MSRLILLFLGNLLFTSLAMSQELTQTVRGTVYDPDSKRPLSGVQVVISGSQPLRGTVSNRNGEFRLELVAPGRIILQLNYIGSLPTATTF